MGDKKHIPCQECGAEIVHGEDTTVERELDFEFGGKKATNEWPAKICPECGHINAI